MKFLVIGLGSMGKRRIRNLQHLNEKDIIGFDLNESRRADVSEKHNIQTFGDFDEAMGQNPDVLIISTPPDHHLEYELYAARNGKHFFCEAGVFTEGMEELIATSKDRGIVAAPSATFRFNDSIMKIKELVDANKIGKVVALTYHMGQYLPDWHPWEDISKFYVGKRSTSATREMVPFEMEWLSWIFGDVKKLTCIKGKVSNLKVDIDDVYQLIFEFESGCIGHLLIDVVSREAIRLIRIVGEEGTIEWSWMDDKVKLFDSETKTWTEYQEEEGFKEEGYLAKENMYIKEIDHFIKAIKGEVDYIYPLEEDYKILKLLEAAENSSDTGARITFNGGE